MTEQLTRERQASMISSIWETDPRWKGIERPYTADDVVRLRGSVVVEHTLARLGAQRLWNLLRHGIVRRRAGRDDRQSGHSASEGGAAGYLPERMASGCGRE